MQQVRIWEITADRKLEEIPARYVSLEQWLEDWLADDISVLDPSLLVIGRQVRASFGGVVDLLGTVRSQTTDGGTDANRGLVTGLRRSRLRDQRTPASQEQPSLRGERDMGVAAAANAKVLSQLVECAAETRR